MLLAVLCGGAPCGYDMPSRVAPVYNVLLCVVARFVKCLFILLLLTCWLLVFIIVTLSLTLCVFLKPAPDMPCLC